ncbi:MAG: permease [Bacillota bacterium]
MKNNNEKSKVKENIKKGIINSIKYIMVISVILSLLYIIFPGQILSALDISQRYGIEMITIFPAVLILMGLADVWVPKSLINKYLGKNSGPKGILISIFLGTLPTGPLYIAFPIAAELLRKKARISNVMIFLGVWASLKIPQISVEIKFLGIKFAIIRFIFTLISIIIIGYVIELLVEKSEVKA